MSIKVLRPTRLVLVTYELGFYTYFIHKDIIPLSSAVLGLLTVQDNHRKIHEREQTVKEFTNVALYR
jgi:hypothetical protein